MVELTPEGVDAQPHVWTAVAPQGSTHHQEDRPFRELALLLIIAANCVPPLGDRCIRFTFLQPGVVVDRAMMAWGVGLFFCLLFCLFLVSNAVFVASKCVDACLALFANLHGC